MGAVSQLSSGCPQSTPSPGVPQTHCEPRCNGPWVSSEALHGQGALAPQCEGLRAVLLSSAPGNTSLMELEGRGQKHSSGTGFFQTATYTPQIPLKALESTASSSPKHDEPEPRHFLHVIFAHISTEHGQKAIFSPSISCVCSTSKHCK